MKKLVTPVCLVFVCCSIFGQTTISSSEIKDHIGQIVSICDRIVDGKFLETGITKPTLLNVGGAYPNHVFTIVINFESRANFPFKPEEFYLNKRVCVSGKLVDFKGKPQMIVMSPADMILNEEETRSFPGPTQGVTNRSLTTPATSKTSPTTPKTNSPASSSSSNDIKGSITPTPAKAMAASSTQVNSTGKLATDTGNGLVKDTFKTFHSYDIKVTTEVNVRSGPGSDFDVSEVINPGTVVNILNAENGWSYVSYRRYSVEQRQFIVLKGFIKNTILK